MKKIALLLICIAMCCGIVACGDNFDYGEGSSEKYSSNSMSENEISPTHQEIKDDFTKGSKIYQEAVSIADDSRVVCHKVDFGQNPRRIYGIIIHSCGNPEDFQEVKESLRTAIWHGFSYHYVIIDGVIRRMVDEEKVAFHAGPSQFPNYPNKLHGVNEDTIGIALKTDMTEDDYKALAWLIKNIMLRNEFVKKELILNHKDVAPGRKTDHEKIDMNKLDQLIDWPKFEKQRVVFKFVSDVNLCKKLNMWEQEKESFKNDAIKKGIYEDVEFVFEKYPKG